MEKSIFRFVLKRSARDQAIIVLITLLSFPVVYLSLELPKIIVNDAISGSGFPQHIFGVSFEQIPYLLLLCLAFLALVILNNVIKFILNVFRGKTGERILRDLRDELYSKVMRTRRTELHTLSAGETVQVISAEVEPLGGFVAEAFATPIFQGGTLAVYLTFIFVQSPFLGMAALVLYPVQVFVIPRMQARVVDLTRERVANVRSLSGEIGESIAGVMDIRANGATSWWRGTIAQRLGRNYDLRVNLMRRKAEIKFVNNVLNQVTPFLFYAIGGYAVIEGRLDLGALVAVIAAYKDIAGPWRELLKYYQTQSDMSVRFRVLTDRFDGLALDPKERFKPQDEASTSLSLPLHFDSVTVANANGEPLLSGINFEVSKGESIALTGLSIDEAEAIAETAVGLNEPLNGVVSVGGQDLAQESEARISKSVALISKNSKLYSGSLLENILVGPQNTTRDPIVANSEIANSVIEEVLSIAEIVGAEDLLFKMGLDEVLDLKVCSLQPAIPIELLEAQNQTREMEGLPKTLGHVVEFWSDEYFNENASIAENLVKGARIPDLAVRNYRVLRTLEKPETSELLLSLGESIARKLGELISLNDSKSQIMTRVGLVEQNELDLFQRVFESINLGNSGKLRQTEKNLLRSIAKRFVPIKHRFFDLPETAREDVLHLRKITPTSTVSGIAQSNPSGADVSLISIREFLLNGKPRIDRQGQWDTIDSYLKEQVLDRNAFCYIQSVGLCRSITAGEGSLSSSQKIKILLIRALVKRPKLIVMDTVFDNHPQINLLEILRAVGDGKPPALLTMTRSTEMASKLDRSIQVGKVGALHVDQ